MRPLVAHCHAGLAKLYRRTGKRQEADKHLATATVMYREMGMTYWLEQVEAEMARDCEADRRPHLRAGGGATTVNSGIRCLVPIDRFRVPVTFLADSAGAVPNVTITSTLSRT